MSQVDDELRCCGRYGCDQQGLLTAEERCPSCGFRTRPTWQSEDAIEAARLRALEAASRAPEPAPQPMPVPAESIAFHLSAITGCTIVGGHNLAMRVGSTGTLTCDAERLSFAPGDSGPHRFAFADVFGVEIATPSLTDRDGPLDGQSGLPRMLEGLLIAGALRKLVVASSSNTLIAVTLRDSSFIWHTSMASAVAITSFVTPMTNYLRGDRPASPTPVEAPAVEYASVASSSAASSVAAGSGGSGQDSSGADFAADSTSASPQSDPLARLERLKRLHATGALRDDEYETARSKIVSELVAD